MAFFTLEQLQPRLFHVVISVFLGVLVFTQPDQHLTASRFYLLQTTLFVVSLGVFYLNMYWAVPKFLDRRRLLPYLGFLVAVVVGISASHYVAQGALASPPGATGLRAPGRTPPPDPQEMPPPPNGGTRPGPGPRSHNWLNPAVLLSTLLMLGLGTSIAAVQRGQQDAQIRQALEKEKLSTELSWLKAQINPHFFFNTLNNIYVLTLMDGDQARGAIHQLSRMMRYVLYDTQTGLAPLQQEVQFIRDYIDLMQLRLTDNVTVDFESPQPLHDAPIAPMLLLTFVENAFKHGVSTDEPSHISVVLRQPAPHVLDLFVRNSVFADRPAALDENSGIGLVNTRRRLELLYPDRHLLVVKERTEAREYLVHLTLNLLP
ncbi:sensor histidine kinase [Hymenobacter sp. BT507]|uniref:Sensor histidine kinase n=1 Tax=Hymenobacter citatus TaxID=2763506 RepID=A0ABR7MNS1_9BACT|nr:sensor histidine kinase [Hymenobacter citatus]MBC6612193.1 sensor histidine kinase [Hymenobacter citatus]